MRRKQLSSLGNIRMHFSRRLSSSLRRPKGLVLFILLQFEGGNYALQVLVETQSLVHSAKKRLTGFIGANNLLSILTIYM